MPEHLRISVVGAGNLATSLVPALKRAGHEVLGVCSRTLASAAALAERVGAAACTRPAELPAADAYVISVTDDALPGVVAELCPLRPEALFLHTAGSMPMDVFRGFAKRYGVLYPMQTFSRARVLEFRDIHMFVEASDEPAFADVRRLALSLGPHVRKLASADRLRLHVAAVFACNFANHCMTLAEREMQQAGLDFRLLMPLVREMVGKLDQLPPHEAQTGPAARGDMGVMSKHEGILADSHTRELYRMMSRSIMDAKKENETIKR